jgi:23S rRNA (adenine2503-C2)-methyltransferase
MAMVSKKADIKEFSGEQLTDWLQEHEIDSYRTDQILKWIYLRQADSFEMMTDLGRDIRGLLTRNFRIDRLKKVKIETSRDGSQKYLFALRDGKQIETVLIPERNHYTLCISSQVGCAQDCRFCLTAAGGFERNLTTGEIVAQVRDVKRDLADPSRLTNVVFMGMGEPLANYRNLVGAIKIITDNEAGLGFANRRVTVSTAGLVPKISALGDDTKVNLAVSLNATDNETRNRLMPLNRKYPLEVLLEACRQFPLPPARRITFEYILIKNINDSLQDARRLAKLLRPIKAKINLIPFNPHEGCEFERPAESDISRFQQLLIRKNYTAIIRHSKGADISAACGQLKARRSGLTFDHASYLQKPQRNT